MFRGEMVVDPAKILVISLLGPDNIIEQSVGGVRYWNGLQDLLRDRVQLRNGDHIVGNWCFSGGGWIHKLRSGKQTGEVSLALRRCRDDCCRCRRLLTKLCSLP